MKKIVFDPRVKVLVFIVSCVMWNASNMMLQIFFVCFITMLLLLSGRIKNGIINFIFFILATYISYTLLNSDPSIPSLIVNSLCVCIRLFIPVVITFTLLFQTTKISEFLAAFDKIHAPAVITIPFAVFFRFVPTVQEEWIGIRQAMAFRGIGTRTRDVFFHPIITTERIIVPLLFTTISVMDELASASLVRGLDSSIKRTCYKKIRMKFIDYIVLVITGIFIYFIIKNIL